MGNGQAKDAELKIDICKEKKGASLDISSLDLKIIKPGMGLSKLKDHLKKLAISSNYIAVLPADLMKLKHLEILDASGNPLRDVSVLGKMDKLKTLSLVGCSLTTLPPEFAGMRCLQKLDLTLNLFESLPECFDKLSSVTEFEIKANKLTNIDRIGGLSSLTTLNLNGNRLTQFSDSLRKCVKLEKIWAENNKLTVLGDEFSTLGKLDELDLNNNQIGEIPASFGKLRLLQVLDLSFNQIQMIQPEFYKLEQLLEANLSRNILVDLSPDIGKLIHLCALNLADNKIFDIPLELGNLDGTLRKFSFEGNPALTNPEYENEYRKSSVHLIRYLHDKLNGLLPEDNTVLVAKNKK